MLGKAAAHGFGRAGDAGQYQSLFEQRISMILVVQDYLEKNVFPIKENAQFGQEPGAEGIVIDSDRNTRRHCLIGRQFRKKFLFH